MMTASIMTLSIMGGTFFAVMLTVVRLNVVAPSPVPVAKVSG
jgi:hypothetical protein